MRLLLVLVLVGLLCQPVLAAYRTLQSCELRGCPPFHRCVFYIYAASRDRFQCEPFHPRRGRAAEVAGAVSAVKERPRQKRLFKWLWRGVKKIARGVTRIIG